MSRAVGSQFPGKETCLLEKYSELSWQLHAVSVSHIHEIEGEACDLQ